MVKLGVDILLEKKMKIIKGKNIGLITNPTGVNSQLISTTDLLADNPEVKLVALFAPEHGIRGDAYAGEEVATTRDKKTNLPVYSLYGKTKKPTKEMIAEHNIEILIFDILDIGVRYYTYSSTMAYAMQAAKENNIKFIVLDRPNPINGLLVEGPVLDTQFSSFIGLYPISLVYGMTIGELALLFNSEFGIGAELEIIPLEGWRREMRWADTNLPWVLPSPHIPHSETCLLYATVGFIGELGTVSVGVGYTLPFELVGAPWMDGEKLAAELNKLRLPGVIFRSLYFRPFYGVFKEQTCSGVQIHITDRNKFLPVSTGLHILSMIYKLHSRAPLFPVDPASHGLKMFYYACGTDTIRKMIEEDKPVDEIIGSFESKLLEFKKIREKYLLY